jgi:hypothetical protein
MMKKSSRGLTHDLYQQDHYEQYRFVFPVHKQNTLNNQKSHEVELDEELDLNYSTFDVQYYPNQLHKQLH